ncbi:hypothetical protein JZK55_14600 [Dissulfurispira thermophila]|uniref:Polymerase nucleotidyl transferase domain-containing protein n=2 Tax=root TaxID=1 RepID=A0A7G1H1N5_9BACT|nr:nucleotidyltransferase domain-containing protein [Dissulfurispira thermophila]BCB96538.1 hypothetical protein JZK55_14600 [Dissulfurispira thermophila]
MAAITDEVIEIAEKFLELLKASNFRIEKAILFGSYVKGNVTEWSDMDIAIISSDFSGIGFYDSKMLIPFLLKRLTAVLKSILLAQKSLIKITYLSEK